jgi:2-dehydro-3-deoxyphosphogluconate aldolase/(4S)-4-hydroxy-2-oxoglutarate aldolase
MEALAFGLDTLKLFPANLLGGPAAIAALSGPFPEVNWVPTGGVTPTNLGEYLKIPSVLAVGGSWMVSRQLLRSDGWDTVRKLMGEALAMARAA